MGGILGEANCLHTLGELAQARSDHEQARPRFEAALPLHRQVGSVQGKPTAFRLSVSSNCDWGTAMRLDHTSKKPLF